MGLHSKDILEGPLGTAGHGGSPYRLGIDIGSASIALALLDANHDVRYTGYLLHRGNVSEALERVFDQMLREVVDPVFLVAVTGSNRHFLAVPAVNEITALIEGARQVEPRSRSCIEIGSHNSKLLVGLDTPSPSLFVNDECAAGTGSFFEAQMERLGHPLEDFSQLVANATQPVHIAGRCSVFAKTDIIHHQQDGASIEDILLGLCYAAARSYKATIAGRHSLFKPVLFVGGTAYNEGVVRALRDLFALGEDELIVRDTAAHSVAIGAARKADRPLTAQELRASIRQVPAEVGAEALFPPLNARDIHVERLHDLPPTMPDSASDLHAWLGIDIGSTSTNLVLLSDDGEVLDYQYLRTNGNPRQAVRDGLHSLQRRFGARLTIKGAATTGSGRTLVGRLIGADLIRDEISAQAASAIHLNPEVDTIIEIGGQDSKFITLSEGLVNDFQMNRICAAGTGSFIEEQAALLSIALEDFGALALRSQHPAALGDRCTVYIEKNIMAALGAGVSKADVAAGLCYSIVRNYLNKVVGSRPIGTRVVLQGGIAHNPAIIAAFNEVLGTTVAVGRFFSVSGAVGAALLVRQARNTAGEDGALSSFKGFDCLDAEDAKSAKSATPQAEAERMTNLEIRSNHDQKVVGIPRALINQNMLASAPAYFEALGYSVLISDESSERTVELAQEHASIEACFPVKLAIGHAAQLLEQGIDYLFLPAVYSLSFKPNADRACVYMQKAPQIMSASLDLASRGVELLSFDLSYGRGYPAVFAALYRLARELKHGRIQAARAVFRNIKAVLAQMMTYLKAAKKRKEEATPQSDNESLAAGQPCAVPLPRFVIISRGYCIVDPLLSLNLSEHIKARGYEQVAVTELGIHDQDMGSAYPGLYWSFAHHVLAAARAVMATPGLYAIYLSYHGCGPDTLVTHWFADEMGAKPCLVIEVDEHSSQVGVITRLEAFIESASNHLAQTKPFDADKAGGGRTATAVSSDHEPATGTSKEPSARTVATARDECSDAGALDETLPVIIPGLGHYSELTALYLEGRGHMVLSLSPTDKRSLERGRGFMRSKESFVSTALTGDVILMAEGLRQAKDRPEQADFQVLVPRTDGAETDGLDALFLHTQLLRARQPGIKLVAPNIEKAFLRAPLAQSLYRIALAGDIATVTHEPQHIQEIHKALYEGLPGDEQLLRWAANVASDTSERAMPSLVVGGEYRCVLNALFQRLVAEPIRQAGYRVLTTPLSEMLLFSWLDASREEKRDRKDDATLASLLASLLALHAQIAALAGERVAFAPSIEQLQQYADKELGSFMGGFGRHRAARRYAGYAAALNVRGIMTVASNYENTQSILDLITKTPPLPHLRLSFDGEDSPLTRLRVEAFLEQLQTLQT
jgi:predicted CoA-substrate-specific enzyme activase